MTTADPRADSASAPAAAGELPECYLRMSYRQALNEITAAALAAVLNELAPAASDAARKEIASVMAP